MGHRESRMHGVSCNTYGGKQIIDLKIAVQSCMICMIVQLSKTACYNYGAGLPTFSPPHISI